MSENIERLKAELAALSVADRAGLAHYLLGSLDPEPDAAAEEARDDELNRRLREIVDGTAAGTPADEVYRGLRDKYS